MKIQKDSWHCRVYRRWYKTKYGYFLNDYSNLCPYMRAVMIWAPLRALFGNTFHVRAIPLGFFTVPTLFLATPQPLGYLSYTAKEVLWLLDATIIGSVCFVSLLFLCEYLFDPKKKNIAGPLIAGLQNMCRESSFFSLLRAYFRSAHDRVCPEVSWGEK